MKRVPTKDYARQYAALWPEVEGALRRCFFEDAPVLGAAVGRFESALAGWHGVGHAVGTSSGTDAALLVYRALGIGPGDEVVTNAQTFAGVPSAILQAGATPVLVDCDPATGRMDPAAVEGALGSRTRAVMAVHMYGHPEQVDVLAELCCERGVDLLEDAAQAHGARWRGRPVGAFGRAAITSFHPSKNLGAFGDGGAVLTDDATLDAQLRVLRNLGKDGKYSFGELGPNAKLDTLQAAVLEVKLRYLDGFTARRRAIATRYLEALADVPGLQLPTVHPDAEPVWHLFVLRTPKREALRAFLGAHGVGTGLHYPIAAHLQAGLAPHLPGDLSLPAAEAWAQTVVSLPLSHEHTDAEVEQVVRAVRAWGRTQSPAATEREQSPAAIEREQSPAAIEREN